MGNLDLYDKVKKVPKEALKTIQGGRLKGFSDINAMWRIKTLTEHFGQAGIGWYYEVIEQKIIEGTGGEIAAFTTIHLYTKNQESDKWNMPIVGVGGSMFVSREKSGMYVNDECFKMALTDAISVACKALGMGADVYFEKDATKYDQTPQQAQQQSQQQTPKQSAPTQSQINMERYDEAIRAINDCALDRAVISEIWKKYVDFQKDKQFVSMVKAKGALITEKQ